MNRNFCLAAFAVGLIAVCWVGVGYMASHPLAFSMTLIIGVVYCAGALELLRFHQATESLARALERIPENLEHLADWLVQVHPSLQSAVRLRIEGERPGLPGPTVTPYLVGLLVMLGMLGTFLGMVVTLNGAVLALESTTDLQTIRASLAAPVKGLGLAFGTSVAGVAASAMLGLISSLCRRQRLLTAQGLDSRIATSLRGFSLVHQRQETFKALQAQSQSLPEVADKLQAMMAQMERHSLELHQRLAASQEAFHRDVREVYGNLAQSVDASLKASLSDSARAAGAAIQPVVEATMAGIARETTSLHERVAAGVTSQVAALAAAFEQGTATLLSGVHADNASLQADLAAREAQRQAALQQSLEGMAASLQQEWRQAGERSLEQQQQICRTLEVSAQSLNANAEEHARRTIDEVARLMQAAAETPRVVTQVIGELRSLQADLAAQDAQRQQALAQSLQAMAASLQGEWQQAGARTLAQQQQICATLEQTARQIGENAQAHASDTINEIARLMQTAAEAPRVAAEVIGELRQQLSGSMVRDNELLEERRRLMETLNGLLDAINHASVEQRSAIDALVSSSAAMLERVGAEFTDKVGGESARMIDVASQMTTSAVEVASLGEAFGHAVQCFAESNDKLVANLQRLEGSLDKSMARSDEQLAYYVAQAREIIDLSIMSQKRIVDDLQGLSARPAAVAGEVG